jgi:hypothetical protein
VTVAAAAPHRTLPELERRHRALGQSQPRATPGRVDLIVLRPTSGERLCPLFGELSPEQGIVGDRWLHANRTVDAQVSLMDVRIAGALAERQHWPLFGDNLFVDLELSVQALPPGLRLRLGQALIEITAEPHLGCKKFAARFGDDALQWVNDKAIREQRVRGVFARILEPGRVHLGDVARPE